MDNKIEEIVRETLKQNSLDSVAKFLKFRKDLDGNESVISKLLKENDELKLFTLCFIV